jgi:hypothetical protein
MGARSVPFASRTSDLAAVAANVRGELCGWSIHESAGIGAAASVIIRNGTSTSGDIVAVIELAANAAETKSLHDSIDCPLGIFLDVTAGEVEGAFWVNE